MKICVLLILIMIMKWNINNVCVLIINNNDNIINSK